MSNFRCFRVNELRHSESISDQKRYFYRSTRQTRYPYRSARRCKRAYTSCAPTNHTSNTNHAHIQIILKCLPGTTGILHEQHTAAAMLPMRQGCCRTAPRRCKDRCDIQNLTRMLMLHTAYIYAACFGPTREKVIPSHCEVRTRALRTSNNLRISGRSHHSAASHIP